MHDDYFDYSSYEMILLIVKSHTQVLMIAISDLSDL